MSLPLMPNARASPVRRAARPSTSWGRLASPETLRTFWAIQLLTKVSISVLGVMECSFSDICCSANSYPVDRLSLARLFGNAHCDGKGQLVVARPCKGAADRHDLGQVACHRHGDQVEAAHLAVGGVEGDPAGTRHKHFPPGMGGARPK